MKIKKGSIITIKPGTKAILAYTEGFKIINGNIWVIDDIIGKTQLNISTLEEGKFCSWIRLKNIEKVIRY
jgi:hypothetical protein